MCDNVFEFCLRTVGASSCLMPPITSNDITDDVFTFGAVELGLLGLSNPLVFNDISVSVRNVKLFFHFMPSLESKILFADDIYMIYTDTLAK